MKKGLLLQTASGWYVATKKTQTEVFSYPVSSEFVRTNKLKHNTPVLFEIALNTVVDMQKYTPVKSYRKHNLSTKPGGSTIKFVYSNKIQVQPGIKYINAYVNTVLERIKDEPEFMMEVYADGRLIWEAGEFVNA